MLDQRVLDQLLDHYHQSFPREAVGVILDDGSTLKIRNWSRRPDRFLSTNLKILSRLGWSAWRYGQGITHFYHSHTQGTHPSQIDQTFMRVLASRWPHVTHLIFTPHQYDIWGVV